MAVRVNRLFDVPFVAGKSKTGKTVYVDRKAPKSFTHKGKRYPALKFIVLHEQVEFSHMRKGMSYKEAHKQAEKVELAAARRAGVPIKAYKKWTGRLIRKYAGEHTHRIPAGLDRRPYIQTHSLRLLRRR